MNSPPYVLFGAGGHARQIVEILEAQGRRMAAYVDPRAADWLAGTHHHTAESAIEPSAGEAVIGLGGVTTSALVRRLELLRTLLARDFKARAVVHPRAIVSASATIDSGAILLACSLVQPLARVREGALVNSAAIIEHDADIGAGAHIAPGAIVLGGAKVGECALVGAGAVVLPGAEVQAASLVPALTRHG